MTINKKQAHVFRWRLLTGTGPVLVVMPGVLAQDR
jgi:hypothetical protein